MDRFQTAKAIADAVVITEEAKALPDVQYSVVYDTCYACDGTGIGVLADEQRVTCWKCHGAKQLERKVPKL